MTKTHISDPHHHNHRHHLTVQMLWTGPKLQPQNKTRLRPGPDLGMETTTTAVRET